MRRSEVFVIVTPGNKQRYIDQNFIRRWDLWRVCDI
jgi:hypothetical protein